MEVKTEEKSAFSNITICYLCLSTHRRVSSVDSVSYAYGLITDWAPQEGARVCWECRALLVRVLRFKVQALRAKEFLDAASLCISGEPIFFGKCMSQLSMRLLTSFTAEFSHSSDTANFTDFPNTSAIKEEVTLSDVEPWGEAVPDDDDFPSEFKVPLEVKSEEPARKKRKRVKSEVKFKREVKSEGKMKDSVVKGKRKKVKLEERKREGIPEEHERRQINDEVVQSFIATEAELTAYRLDVLTVMSKNSKFMCDTCLAPFKDEMKLHRHNDQCHGEDVGAFVCDICSSRFATAEIMLAHWNWHYTLYRCRYPACRFVHHRVMPVRSHYLQHSRIEEISERKEEQERFRSFRKYECNHCGKVFKERRQIMVHMKCHDKRVMCELCAYKCTTLSQLKKHTLAHLAPSHRPHECHLCHKRFIDRHKLLLHTRTHTGERPFKCSTCGLLFVSKECMTRHIKDRHSDPSARIKKKFAQPRTKSFFINKPSAAPSDKTNDDPDGSGYKVIIDPETNKYVCYVCDKKLSELQTFRKHYFRQHTDRKPRQRRSQDPNASVHCHECDKTFKFPSELQRHISVLHKGERPHQCNVCGARFASKQVLQVHMSSHSNDKPFKCEECSLTFKYAAGLWSHRLIHKGEKPHQCTICGARFTLRGNLVGHMKSHTNDRPFECNICGRKFPWKRNLRNHFKTHAKEQQLIQLQ